GLRQRRLLPSRLCSVRARTSRARCMETLETRLALATWTVTTVADTAGEEGLSLAEAIRLANETEGPDEIVFDLPMEESEPLDQEGNDEARVFVFRPLRPLPILDDETGGTTIDGTSQTRAGGDSNPFGPEIVL